MAPNLDLKSSLTLRVVAVALFCFLIAAALALFDLGDKGFKLHAMIPFEAPVKPVQ